MFFRSILFCAFVFLLTACNSTGNNSTETTGDNPTVTIGSLVGAGEKGPFRAGSIVTLSKLDDHAQPILSSTITTTVTDDQGNFSLGTIPWDGWVQLQVSGHYFDEYVGQVSEDLVTLDAITLKDKRLDTANVNLFTHIAAKRIRALILDGQNNENAWRQTQAEMKLLFDLEVVSQNFDSGVEQLNLANGKDDFARDNANLLLFTGSFLALGGDAEMLTAIAEDFSDDGQLNGIASELFKSISQGAAKVGLLTELSQNLSGNGSVNPPTVDNLVGLPDWVDSIAPVINLNGSETITIEAGSEYSDEGATALDNLDGDISSNIIIEGEVDINVPGTYTIIYRVKDAANNSAAEVVRTVNVEDTTAPVITLVGSATVALPEGIQYVDAGVLAQDSLDGDLSLNVMVNNYVNTFVPGNYQVTYDVVDNAGNKAEQVVRTVIVTEAPDTTIPVIHISQAIISLVEGTAFVEDATATDNKDGNITAKIVISGSVDTSKPGTYTLKYNVKDAAKNAAVEVTRKVTVTPVPVVNVSGTVSGTDSSNSLNGDIDVYTSTGVLIKKAFSQVVNGEYALELKEMSDFVLLFKVPGYIDQSIRVATATDLVQNIVLVKGDVPQTVDSTNGIDTSDSTGLAAVKADANSFVNNAGQAISGNIILIITPINASSSGDVSLVSDKYSGEQVSLVNYGVVDLDVKDEAGQKVELQQGKTAEVTIPLYLSEHPDGTPIAVGDELSVWSFDEKSSQWVETSTGEVTSSTTSPTGFAVTAPVDKLGKISVSARVDSGPDNVELDSDGDGVPDRYDAFPDNTPGEHKDTDGDGIGNNEDNDDDDDGVPDRFDYDPLDSNIKEVEANTCGQSTKEVKANTCATSGSKTVNYNKNKRCNISRNYTKLAFNVGDIGKLGVDVELRQFEFKVSTSYYPSLYVYLFHPKSTTLSESMPVFDNLSGGNSKKSNFTGRFTFRGNDIWAGGKEYDVLDAHTPPSKFTTTHRINGGTNLEDWYYEKDTKGSWMLYVCDEGNPLVGTDEGNAQNPKATNKPSTISDLKLTFIKKRPALETVEYGSVEFFKRIRESANEWSMMGLLGEKETARILEKDHWTIIKSEPTDEPKWPEFLEQLNNYSGQNGIDGVFEKNEKYIISDSKTRAIEGKLHPSSTKIGAHVGLRPTDYGYQLSNKWIEYHLPSEVTDTTTREMIESYLQNKSDKLIRLVARVDKNGIKFYRVISKVTDPLADVGAESSTSWMNVTHSGNIAENWKSLLHGLTNTWKTLFDDNKAIIRIPHER